MCEDLLTYEDISFMSKWDFVCFISTNETTDMRKKYLLILSLFIALMIYGCCFFPEINYSTYKHLYAGNVVSDEIYIIDLKNNTIVDTLTGFRNVNSITATKSGEKLYVSTIYGGINRTHAIYSVDLHTKNTNKIIDKESDVFISPSGLPFIIASTPHDSIRAVGIIDTITDEITFIDSLDIWSTRLGPQTLAFDPNEKVFYTWSNDLQFFSYNYEEKRIVKKYTSAYPYLINFIISKDGRYLYFSNGPVVDVLCDSIVGYIPANSPNNIGRLALSPDGEYLYLTDPGIPLNPEILGSGEIKIFETNTITNVGSINVNDASGKIYTMTEGIVINKTGSKAYVSGNYHDIYVIDLRSNKVKDVIDFEEFGVYVKSLALGI